MPYSIAIDGPAGAGKSTIAKLLSKSLGFCKKEFLLEMNRLWKRKFKISM